MKKPIALIIAAVALAIAAFFFLRPTFQPGTPMAPSRTNAETAIGTSAQISASPAAAPKANAHDVAQAEILQSVLDAHNDNDMRMDTELKVLGEGAKKLFEQKYDQISPEKRNERGTIVFLVGRNLSSESDFAFMSKVLAEAPCRSMQNCASDPPPGHNDPHGDNAVEVSLAYPQIVALKSLERALDSGRSNPNFEQAMNDVHKATQSPVPIVANLARGMETKYSRR